VLARQHHLHSHLQNQGAASSALFEAATQNRTDRAHPRQKMTPLFPVRASAWWWWWWLVALLSSETPRSCTLFLRRGGGTASCSSSSIYTHAQVRLESPTTTTTTTSSSLSSSSHQANTRRTAATTTMTKTTRDDYLVQNLDRIVPAFAQFPGTMYAGLIPTSTPWNNDDDGKDSNDGKKALMFWLFAPDEPVYDDTLVVWMNGGPGCSSLGGALFEHGPVTIPLVAAGGGAVTTTQVPNGTPPPPPLAEQLRYNEQSWTRATAMLYLEHPVGTGFSVSDPTQSSVLNETDVARDVYGFLSNFYTIFGPTNDETTTTTDWSRKQLYLFGESYAGMYVPSVAHYIYEQNQALKRNNKHSASAEQQQHPQYSASMPLAGIALGNGWMNALVQGPAVIDYAWWHGLIDSATKRNLHQEWDNCKDTATDTDENVRTRHHPNEPYPFHRFTVPDECGILGAVLSAAGTGQVQWGGPNAYDVTTWDE
jgi:carboxypeptidase C (cathepsin A)